MGDAAGAVATEAAMTQIEAMVTERDDPEKGKDVAVKKRKRGNKKKKKDQPPPTPPGGSGPPEKGDSEGEEDSEGEKETEATPSANPVSEVPVGTAVPQVPVITPGNMFTDSMVPLDTTKYEPLLRYVSEIPKVQIETHTSPVNRDYFIRLKLTEIGNFTSLREFRSEVFKLAAELTEQARFLLYDIPFEVPEHPSDIRHRIIKSKANGLDVKAMWLEGTGDNTKLAEWVNAAHNEMRNMRYTDDRAFALPGLPSDAIRRMHATFVKNATAHLHPILQALRGRWEQIILASLRPYSRLREIVQNVLDTTTQYTVAVLNDGEESMRRVFELPRDFEAMWTLANVPENFIIRRMMANSVLRAVNKFVPVTSIQTDAVAKTIGTTLQQRTNQPTDLTSLSSNLREELAIKAGRMMIAAMCANRHVRLHYSVSTEDMFSLSTFIMIVLMKLLFDMRILTAECINKVDNWLVLQFFPILSQHPPLTAFIVQARSDPDVMAGRVNLMSVVYRYLPPLGARPNVNDVALRDFVAFAATGPNGQGWAGAGNERAMPWPNIAPLGIPIARAAAMFYGYAGHNPATGALSNQVMAFKTMINSLRVSQPLGTERLRIGNVANLLGTISHLSTETFNAKVARIDYAQRMISLMSHASPVSTAASFTFAPFQMGVIAHPEMAPVNNTGMAIPESRDSVFEINPQHVMSLAFLSRYDSIYHMAPPVCDILNHDMALSDAVVELMECYSAVQSFVDMYPDDVQAYSKSWKYATAFGLMRKVKRPVEFEELIAELNNGGNDFMAAALLEIPRLPVGVGYKQSLLLNAHDLIMDNLDQFGVMQGVVRTPDTQWVNYGIMQRRPLNRAMERNTFDVRRIATESVNIDANGNSVLAMRLQDAWKARETVAIELPFKFKVAHVSWKPKIEPPPVSFGPMPDIVGPITQHLSYSDERITSRNLDTVLFHSDQEWLPSEPVHHFNTLADLLNYLRHDVTIYRLRYVVDYSVELTPFTRAVPAASHV